MKVSKAIATVVGTSIGFGAAGTGVGLLLGKIAPSFYRQTIRLQDPDNYDAAELGIGLGLTNGLIWGLVVGVLLVAILTWKESRSAKTKQTDS